MAVKKTLSEQVYISLKKGIVEGRYEQGSELTELILADEYKVSRTPIREALKRLEKENLVRIIPHKGALVVKPSLKDIIEINELREGLEGLAARLSARWVNQEEIEQLLVSFPVKYDNKLKEEDYIKSYNIGLAMHEMIKRNSRNKRLNILIENIQNQIYIIMEMNADIPGRYDMAYDEHRDILEALLEKDPDKAEKAMKTHIRRVSDSLIEYMQKG